MDHHLPPPHLLHQPNSDALSTSVMDRRMVAKRCAESSSPLDCESLQSSIKRVKLSRSPGELRLQRDLALLRSHGWVQVDMENADEDGGRMNLAGCTTCPTRTVPVAMSPTTSTWLHTNTQARLSLVDSLRLCLFLPQDTMSTDESINSDDVTTEAVVKDSFQSAGELTYQGGQKFNNPSQEFYPHPVTGMNYGNGKRMWIQFPRRYPHKPPAVSRIEGFALERVVVNDAPPPSVAGIGGSASGSADDGLSPSSMARSQSSCDVSSLQTLHECGGNHAWGCGGGEPSSNPTAELPPRTGETAAKSSTSSYQVCAGGTTVVWNHWSPVVGLGEFLDFLLELSQISSLHNPHDATFLGSINIHGRTPLAGTSSLPHLLHESMPGSMAQPTLLFEEHKLEDQMSSSASTPRASNVEAVLKPNRFDVGYAKAENIISGSSSGTSGCGDACDFMNIQPFRDVTRNGDDDDDDDAMEL